MKEDEHLSIKELEDMNKSHEKNQKPHVRAPRLDLDEFEKSLREQAGSLKKEFLEQSKFQF